MVVLFGGAKQKLSNETQNVSKKTEQDRIRFMNSSKK